jgi:hypothetical protein
MAVQPRVGLLPQRWFGPCGCHPGDIAITRQNLGYRNSYLGKGADAYCLRLAGFKLVIKTRRIRRGHTLKIHSFQNS